MTPSLFVLGDVTVDHFMTLDQTEAELRCSIDTHECTVTLPYGEKVPTERYDRIIAGNAANAAVGAARLGLATSLWSIMGNDATGHDAQHQLAREGIDLDHFRLIHGATSNVSVVIRVLEERTILVHHERRDYQLPDLPPADWIYLTSLGAGWESLIEPLAASLKASGSRLVFQPGTYQLRTGHHRSRFLVELAEIFVCNRAEAAEYTNHTLTDPIERLFVAMHTLGPRVVVITDGLNGSYASDGRTIWFLEARRDVPRVDATGAGDAYAIGFSVARCHGADIPTAMQWGNVNAESVVGHIGSQKGLLALDAMEERLADPATFRPAIYREKA